LDAVKNTQNDDAVTFDAVGNDIQRAGPHKLAGAIESAGTPALWVTGEIINRRIQGIA
jgi:hypothetical protein